MNSQKQDTRHLVEITMSPVRTQRGKGWSFLEWKREGNIWMGEETLFLASPALPCYSKCVAQGPVAWTPPGSLLELWYLAPPQNSWLSTWLLTRLPLLPSDLYVWEAFLWAQILYLKFISTRELSPRFKQISALGSPTPGSLVSHGLYPLENADSQTSHQPAACHLHFKPGYRMIIRAVLWQLRQ